ncbi:dihydrodipicolinate synthase family protein [Stappia sp.]|uniref:dihydrodipicolinate synthase family protein n=1 Tax=Stappia sp. TaxID=1870903 RepID=UPI003A993999
MTSTLSGILPVLPTPFTDAGEVDASAMRRLLRFALDCGVDGVVFPGFASEVEKLDGAERSRLLAIVAEEVGGRVPIIAGASAGSVAQVIEHGRAAAAVGVHHLMIHPPVAVGSEAAAVTAFMAEVAAGLPDARIVLQNAPAPRGSDISPEALVVIARAVPQVVYIKEETLPAGPAISHLVAHGPETLAGIIGGGGARYILDEYARGACAAMPAIEIVDEHVAMDRAWRAGRRDEARAIYVRTLPLLTLQAVYRMRLTKHVMSRRGILENTIVRAPTPELDAQAIADIDANLAELGLVDVPLAARGGRQ